MHQLHNPQEPGVKWQPFQQIFGMDTKTAEKRGSSDSPPAYPNEKARDIEAAASPHDIDIDDGSFDEIRRTREIQDNIGVLRSLRRAEEWLDSKVGIELQGVDRIPEEEKQPPSTWNIFLFWWSLNVHVGVIPLGILGPEFGLSLQQTVAASIVGTILGASCTAFTGTLGPKVSTALERIDDCTARWLRLHALTRPCYVAWSPPNRMFSVLLRLLWR